MIQRIQSLYLLLALLLIESLFFMDMALFASDNTNYILTYLGIFEITSKGMNMVMPSIALNILLWVTSIALVVTIFLFKKRVLQIRIAGLSLGLLAGLTGLIFFFGKSGAKELSAELSFTWSIIFPIIAIVLVIMAIRAIGKDEALVKSLDRLRP
ncbi:MAG TPA: DUF4293 domain-containing protein [Marinilabiliaceae bacterium]|nr:DUF4293 domain-containing protein [Marinilabiliaceae bacterium]